MPTAEEKRFVKTALARKFCTRDQVEHCLKVRKDSKRNGGDPPSLTDLLVQERCLTQHQLDLVRRILADEDRLSAASDSSHPEGKKGQVINGYEIIRKIDKGAMGTVYKARQVSMDRIVALKILSRRLSRDKEFIERFEREARATARLSHPNIILGIDVGEADGRRYFVMEYVDGRTVQDLLTRGGALDEKRALSILLQIARALEHAHKHSLVHRDIKPENIMVTRDGQAKLCDLGLAKVLGKDSSKTEAGKSLGTPNYISPEQARGDVKVDIRSDLYSLGASLFHMVVGQVPYSGSPAVVMTKHIYEELPDPKALRPELSDDVVRLIRKMMAKDAKDRFQAPSELVAAIEKFLDGKPIESEDGETEEHDVESEEAGSKSKRLRGTKRVRRRTRRKRYR